MISNSMRNVRVELIGLPSTVAGLNFHWRRVVITVSSTSSEPDELISLTLVLPVSATAKFSCASGFQALFFQIAADFRFG